jgi:hypothetical protein
MINPRYLPLLHESGGSMKMDPRSQRYRPPRPSSPSSEVIPTANASSASWCPRPGRNPVRKSQEVFLVDCVEHLHHSALNDLVLQCGDPQLALAPIGFFPCLCHCLHRRVSTKPGRQIPRAAPPSRRAPGPLHPRLRAAIPDRVALSWVPITPGRWLDDHLCGALNAAD